MIHQKIKRLAVIPSDPLQAYVDKGRGDLLESYYNPCGYFDEVYCLSPLEKTKYCKWGIQVIPTAEREFSSRLRELNIDIVRAYGGYWACDLACNNKVEGIPVVVSVHDTNKSLLHQSILQADHVLSVSEAVSELLVSSGVQPHRIHRLPNRVDLNVFQPIVDLERQKQLHSECNAKYVIVHVGRKTEQKNQDTVIRALKILGSEYACVFIGRETRNTYRILAQQCGVAHQCYFIDSVQNADMAKFYSFCDCMCTPSRWEGFGIVFIEALACNGVVVTSDIAPMNEFIINGKNGILVKDYENPDSIAKAIEMACKDRSLRNCLQANARGAAEPFSKEKIDILEKKYYEQFLREKCVDEQNTTLTCESISNPAVSIVLPTYNHVQFLPQAIECMRKQTYRDFELIIVNDGSTDGTREYLEKLNEPWIRVIHQENKKLPGALNTGFAAARGKYLTWISSDNLYAPQFVEKLAEALEANPQTGLAYGGHAIVDEKGAIAREVRCATLDHARLLTQFPGMAAFMYRRECQNLVGLYDTSLEGAEDWDMWLRIAEAFPFIYVDAVLCFYRLHDQTMTSQKMDLIKCSSDRAFNTAIARLNSVSTETSSERLFHALAAVRKASDAHDVQKSSEALRQYAKMLQQCGDAAAMHRKIKAAYTAAQKQGVSIPSSMAAVTQLKQDIPVLSVVLTAYNRADMLRQALDGFAAQTAPRNAFEVIVVDDGSQSPVKELVESYSSNLDIKYIYQDNSGLAAARNTGITAVRGEIVLFHDDDDLPHPDLIAEHIKSHRRYPDESIAVIGHLEWHPSIKVTPLMHYITGPGGQYFGYTKMQDGRAYDAWKWWGGLISAKTSLLKSMESPFDPIFRFGCEDAELTCRLIPRNIAIVYNANAKKYVLRPMDFEEFSRRRVKQGRAMYHLAQKHPAIIRPRYRLDTAMREYVADYLPNLPKWRKAMLEYEPLLNANPTPFIDGTDPVTVHLHKIWAHCFRGYFVQGYLEELRAAQSGTSVMTSPVCLEPLKISENSILPQPAAQAAGNQTAKPPKVAIITSCYNAEKFLAETLDSIFAQTMPDWELWLLDDASADATPKIIAEYARRDPRIKAVYFNDNQGPYVRRNYAIEKTQAPFIVIQDADDLMTPDKLDVLYNAISADDNCGVVGHWYRSFIDEFTGVENTELRQFPLEQEEIKKTFLCYKTAIVHGAAIIRKKLFDCIGYYDAYLFGSDSIFLEKAAQYWNYTGTMSMKNVSNCLMYRRMHLASQTGLLPTFDPRSRRGIYRRYAAGRLNALTEQLCAFRGTPEQLHQLFRAVSCDGFLRECGDAITGSEARPFPWQTAVAACGTVMKFLQNKMFVSVLIWLHQIETLAPDAPKRIRNFELYKAIAFWSLGQKDRARACVENELNGHAAGAAAACFKVEFIDQNSSVDILQWIRQRAVLHDTELRDITVSLTNRPATASNGVPKIAVVTACYNAEKFLAETIESILTQTMNDFELWLLDDGSTDGTRQIIADYAKRDARIKAVYFDDNTGPYVRRNYAIERTAAPFIVIHDGDDIMTPVKLETLYHHIGADDNLGVVGHWYRSFIDEFKDIRHTDIVGFPLEQDTIRQTLLEHGAPLVHGAAIIRKRLFEHIGLYDANRAGSDSFWLEKAGLYWHHTKTMAFKNIPDCLMLRRMHAASQTGSLPLFDHRSRRRIFRLYSARVLEALAAQLRTGNSSDVPALFRQTTCDDFLQKYADQIKESESQPLPEGILLGFACKAIEFFNQGLFVTCINRLNGVETIAPNAAKRFKNFCLLKAIAFYALEMREKCAQYLAMEIQDHDNPAARQFAADSRENNAQINVIDWCIANDPIYDLRITELHAVARSDMPDEHISPSAPLANAAAAEPLVSVVMPAYNAEKDIAEAIKSVLDQSHRTVELIVVDDGSTDRTKQIVAGFADKRIKYIYKENGGASSARNRGIQEAGGEFLITLDADDMMAPGYIAAHLRHYAQHQDADMVYCDQRLIDEEGNFIKEIRQFEYQNRSHLIRDMFRCGYSVILPLGCFKRSVIEKIGRYDEALLIGEDYDLMRRFILHNCKAVHLSETLYLRRMQPQSLSRTATQATAMSHFTAVRRWLETFSCEELFPDVDWSKIPKNRRGTFAQMLIGATYRTIGKNYAQAQVQINAAMAFDLACCALKESLKNEPANNQARILLDQCEDERRQLMAAETAVTAAVK